MGMMETAKKTGHSIGRCHTLIRLQYSQQYQSQWTSSCPVFWQMVQSCIFNFFLESWEMVGGAGGVGEKDVIKKGIALSFDEKVGVFVQLSFNLLDHESVLL